MSTQFPIQKTAPLSCFLLPKPCNANLELNAVPILYKRALNY